MPKVNRNELGDCHIPVPPLDEQQTIADFLDRKTAQIDTLIAKKQRQIELLGEKRQALISQAVTKGLDPTVPMKDSGIPWLGYNSGSLEAYAASSPRSRSVAPRSHTASFRLDQMSKGVSPYIRTSDMAGTELPREGYLRTSVEIDRAYTRSKVHEGDIVVAIRATVGKSLPVPDYLNGANLTQGTAKVSPGPKVDRSFLLWAMNSTNSQNGFESFSKGATFKEITLEMLRWFWIALPPLIEQSEIANHLSHESKKIDTVSQKLSNQIAKLHEYRQTLISVAVTGKIAVPTEVQP